ncbi:MAG: NADPH-dependent F420 reductase [Steroidobacteraceae bacterium]
MKKTDATLSRRNFIALAGHATAAMTLLGVSSTGRAAAPGGKVKIGIVGSGNVGTALGRLWAQAGHQVMFSSRSLDADRTLASEIGANASAGVPKEAVAFGDVVLFAVPYLALPDLAKELAPSLRGKIVIDACNPIPARDGDIANWAREKGAGLATAELLPGARIVRGFNAIPAAKMGAANKQPPRIGMPIAGDDKAAIDVVTGLVSEIGYEAVLVGGLAMGRHLIPGGPLAGEHTADEIRKIVAGL